MHAPEPSPYTGEHSNAPILSPNSRTAVAEVIAEWTVREIHHALSDLGVTPVPLPPEVESQMFTRRVTVERYFAAVDWTHVPSVRIVLDCCSAALGRWRDWGQSTQRLEASLLRDGFRITPGGVWPQL